MLQYVRPKLYHSKIELANENEAANYLKNLSSQEFVLLMSKDFSDYIKF